MPRGDGTGPKGYGPMTGRGRGFCVRTFETGETSYVGGNIRRGFRSDACLDGDVQLSLSHLSPKRKYSKTKKITAKTP